VQVEGAAERVWQLGNDIQKVQSLGKERGDATNFRSVASRGDNRSACGGSGVGQHILQGTSGCSWGLEKNGKQCIGKSKGGWNTKLHVVSADDKVVIEMHLSGGECHDAPEGRKSIAAVGGDYWGVPLLMDRAYEGDETRMLAMVCGHKPVVPPKENRKDKWEYDKEKYKGRNVVERLFRRLEEFRRVFTRYDKTDTMFLAYIQFAFIVIWLN